MDIGTAHSADLEHTSKEIVQLVRSARLPVLVADTESATMLGRAGVGYESLPNIAQSSSQPSPSGLRLIAQLEALRSQKRAGFLVLTPRALPWLERYPGFREHVERRYRLVAGQRDSSLAFDLWQQPPGIDHAAVAAIEEVISAFEVRYGRAPALLDWNTGLDLRKKLRQCSVFSPVIPDAVLPYLDHSIDIIVAPGEDALCLAEAQRVAAVAVLVCAQESQRSDLVRVVWQPGAAPPLSVSIVIPWYHSGHDPETALASLSETLPATLAGEIIVATDRTITTATWMHDELGQWERHVRMTHEHDQSGFGPACVVAAREATGEILVFLAGDAVLLPHWFPFLMRTFVDRSDAGIVGGKLLNTDGTLHAAGDITVAQPEDVMTGAERDAEDPAYNYVRAVLHTSAAFLATPRRLFLELGGFHGDSPPDAELNYCRRVRDNHLAVYYQPMAAAIYPVVPAGRPRHAQGYAR